MIQALWISLSVGFGVIGLFLLFLECASLVVLASEYDYTKKSKEQSKECYLAWFWAKFLVIFLLLSVMLSVYCGVYAGKV